MEITIALLLSTLCTFLTSTLGQDTSVPLPEFVTHPKEYSFIVRQQPVTLTCEAYDAMDITFNCLGAKVAPERQKNYQRFEPDSGRILVKATIDVDYNKVHGIEDYWCECFAWTSAGPIEEGDTNTPQYVYSNRGFVMIPYLEKEFVLEPKNQVVEEDSEVELRCSPPEGNPQPTMYWKKGNHRVNPEEDTNLIITESGSLIIQNFQMTDEGDYTCVAKNLAGKRESKAATLTLQDYIVAGETYMFSDEQADEATEDPFLLQPETDYWVTENDPVPITCKVKGAEILEFRCGGTRIDESKIDKDVENERGPNQVITAIHRVSKADAELFKRQQNRDYSCNCFGWFIVNGAWVGKDSSVGVIKPADLEEKFGNKMKDMTVAPGSTVSFHCRPPRGHPRPKIIWTLNGQQINSGGRIRIDRDMVTFEGVVKSNQGELACIAQNIAGSREMRAMLKVSDDAEMVDSSKETTDLPTTLMTTPTPGEPYFAMNLEEMYYTSKNQPAVLTCAVHGARLLTFRCNGNRLPQDDLKIDEDYDRSTNVESTKASVEIKKGVVSKFLQGGQKQFSCMCVAWHAKSDGSWGTKESNTANIMEGYMRTDFMVPPQDTTVSVGRTVVFDCVAPEGAPEPTIRWTKENQVIDTTNRRYEMVDDGSLTIFNVRRRDAGRYTCVAENGAGVAYSRAATLTVLDSDETTVYPEPETTDSPVDETTEQMTTTTEVSLDSGLPFFIRQPEPVVYVARNKPATITCRTLGAEYLTFECNGARIPEAYNDTFSAIDPETNRKILERSITVLKETVEDAVDGVYECACSAWYADNEKQGWAQIDKVGKVEVAYLRRAFQQEPMGKTVAKGSAVEMLCVPPKGNPEPSVFWMKDGVMLDDAKDDNIMVSSTGSLVFNEIQMEDEGNYSCVAENVASKRMSMSAEIKVSGDVIAEPHPESTSEPTPEPESESTPEPDAETTAEPVRPVVSVATNGPPVFSKHLDKTTYVIRGKSSLLTCAARQTGKISFMCNGEDIDDERVMLSRADTDGEEVLYAVLEMKSKVVEGLEVEYACECLAWYKLTENEPEQYVNSRRGIIELAYIEETFTHEPADKTSPIGKMVTFMCGPPDGFPRPEIFWNKNGEMIDLLSNGNLLMPGTGSLVIVQVNVSDAGSYSCTAFNKAGSRTSQEASLTVIDPTESSTSIPEPEPETTTEMIEEHYTEDETNVTSEVMPSAEYTTESMPENTTVYIDLGTDGKEITGDSTPEPEPGTDDKDKMLPYPECKRLQMCFSGYLMKTDPTKFDLHDSCPDLQKFLECAHDAMTLCNIEHNKDASATLSDISGWFEEFCQRMQRRNRIEKKCSSYKRCDAPIDMDITPEKLIDMNYWCTYISKTTECRQVAVAETSCKVEKKNKMKSDLHYLETKAHKYCPIKQPIPEPTEPVTGIMVDEVGGDGTGAAGKSTISILVSTFVQVLAMLIISFR